MLSQDNIDLLCKVGPGTPMGEVMRRYWLPALMSEEVAEPDGPPVRVGILGEKLVAAGVPILEAINITRETTGNEVFARALAKVHDGIREGESFAGGRLLSHGTLTVRCVRYL